MKHKVKILTEDPDLGLTLLLWLADYFRNFEHQVTITDKNESGELLTDELEEDEIRCEQDYTGAIKIECSPSLLSFTAHSAKEAVRKAQLILGVQESVIDLDHVQVIKRQQHIRNQFHTFLELEPGDPVCRFLLRVDGFPHADIDPEEFLSFHNILRTYRVPYLLTLNLEKVKVTENEVRVIHECIRGGANIALQGPATDSLYKFSSSLKRWEEELRVKDIWTLGFVAAEDRYNVKVLPTLREYYELLCGGPNSVESVGYRPPSFLRNALYIPSYREVHNLQASGLKRLDQFISATDGITIPITIDFKGEKNIREDFLQDLALRLSDRTFAWDEYLYEARILKQRAGVC